MLIQRKRLIAHMHHAFWLCFVSPSLQCCYEENIIYDDHQCISPFCKPILAMLLQRKRLIAHMHHACFCFVSPSFRYLKFTKAIHMDIYSLCKLNPPDVGIEPTTPRFEV